MFMVLMTAELATYGQRETANTKSQSASEEATVLTWSDPTCNEKSKRQNCIRRKEIIWLIQ